MKAMKNKDFAIFILTHGRADRVFTYDTLMGVNYQGDVYFIVDDEDDQLEDYQEKFGKDRVKVFSKDEIAKEFDLMDNFKDKRAVVYARNACFDIAEEIGVTYFMMLDDDYTDFSYRYDRDLDFIYHKIKNIEPVLDCLIDFYKKVDFNSVAIAQAGDFIGGDNGFAHSHTRIRKCMNTFICSTERRFKFVGRINEDVNTYIKEAYQGGLFLTVPFVMVTQTQTQANEGGLTDIYLNLGTYVKSFYPVIINPSSVSIAPMGQNHKRLHHRIKGRKTYQKIISNEYATKKEEQQD